MTAKELQNICRSSKKLTIEEVQDILWELKEDCFNETLKDLKKGQEDFYYGEINAFYICLNRLEKVEGE